MVEGLAVSHENQDSLDGSGLTSTGEFAEHGEPQQPLKQQCPECGSVKLYRDGLRYLSNGNTVQRWLCRDCGFRFSQSDYTHFDKSQRLSTVDTQSLNRSSAYSTTRQVCDLLAEESKNLNNAAESKTVAGDNEEIEEIKGKILQFLVKLKNDGIQETTIQNYAKFLRLLVEKGARLHDPESVKQSLANQDSWACSTKQYASIVYGKYAEHIGLQWKKPRYQADRKIPFIPLETELDSLIAHCGKKLATLIKVLKDTGMRVGEALRLEWQDIDVKNNTITLNRPEKHGVCRMLKVSSEAVGMLNALPKKTNRIFGTRALTSYEGDFSIQRRRAAAKLQNPRLLQIHFHTFRHWKATMEYHKTKDILHVMALLGHRNVQNTMLYTQLVNFEGADYHSSTAKTIEEAAKLVESGFEYVVTVDNIMLFRKRK